MGDGTKWFLESTNIDAGYGEVPKVTQTFVCTGPLPVFSEEVARDTSHTPAGFQKPPSALPTSGIISTPDRLTAEKRAELRRQWKEQFGLLSRGWVTANEIRATEGLAPVVGGDDLYVPREHIDSPGLLSDDAREFLRILAGAIVGMGVCGIAVKLILTWMGGV